MMKKALFPSHTSKTCLQCLARSLRLQYRYGSNVSPQFSDTFGTLGSMAIDMLPTNNERQGRNAARRRDLDWHLNKEGEQVEMLGKSLLRFELQQNIEKPVISEPVKWLKRKREKLKKEALARQHYEETYGPTLNAKLLIECARKEFNHYEGMRYPDANVPLVSEYWAKGKYKNDWFVLRRTAKNPSFANDTITSWAKCAHLLHPIVVDNILSLGFKQPTLIQARSLNAFKGAEHLFIAAETGSGKTLAYAAPLISEMLEAASRGRPFKVVVLVLSSELRIQTRRMFDDLLKGTNIRIVSDNERSLGNPITIQDWDILIGTAGMVRDCLRASDTSDLRYLIVDEADMLLDDSFVDVMSDILARLNIRYSESHLSDTGASIGDDVRVVFASATCPPELHELAEGIVDGSHLHYVQAKNIHTLMRHVQQKFIRTRERDKLSILEELLRVQLSKPEVQTLVFCKDGRTVQFVSESLVSRGIENVKIGGISKNATRFDDSSIIHSRIIVATDRAARGLDLPLLSHVINYDFPRHMVDYIHRAGRVGRVGSRFKCRITSFVRCPWEVELVNAIEEAARFNTPIQGVEINVAGMLKERKTSELSNA
uniref:ATP-dependent RNA helicase n=1 Tax=Ascaris suum TaxID=6253 RepID=F1KX56_ASCSU